MKQLTIAGNVGKDPEIRADKQGNPFATFSLAVKIGKRVDWVQVTCGGGLSEIVRNYVKKGATLVIVGTSSVSAYIDKNGEAIGVERLYAINLEILSARNSDNSKLSPEDNLTANMTENMSEAGDNSEYEF